MLLNFTCNNFKSFRDGFSFNMEPESRMTELRYSILSETIVDHEVKGLSSSVVYGPNAAGKTSIVNAMSCLKQLVLRGNVNDDERDSTHDHVSNDLSLAPFAFRENASPVSFDVTFTYKGSKFRYYLSVFVGNFNDECERYVDGEKLYYNDELIFSRNRTEVTEFNVKPIIEYLNNGYEISESKKTQRMMSDNISQDSLLLVTDFNSFCSKKLVFEVREWFERQFKVINNAGKTRFIPKTPDDETGLIFDGLINKVAAEAGIVGSAFIYFKDAESHSTTLVSVLEGLDSNRISIDSEKIESMGTLRLIAIMPVVISALRDGSVLVMDEFDTSLHPMIVMNIISIFHNDDVNKKGAQLIFNTHNPIYLNHDLLRRDEIKFVERDMQTKSSTLYSLSDFKANGEASVRKTSDYMKNYFINRYGAIVDFDITDIVLHAIEGGKGLE